MGMLKEYKEFAMKGNLVDIAVAFVMGASFGKVVTSLNEGVVMPLVGMLLGDFDLAEKKYVLKEGTEPVIDSSGNEISAAVTEVSIKWGAFVTAVIDFIIIAFVMFLIIRAINSMKKKQEAEVAAAPEPSLTDKLLMEIRDQLKK
ncbi:MAG: large conductance mechanosensitive channel protein MscL [Chitinophagaceae bacterium]|jgi:large conductance mechanosensitive channel|nr:large conductance mechanosensitive channel protein MscL [Chitinophagaceae bacterium]